MTGDPWGWQAFSDAARSYLEGAATASADTAARRFSDFLREQFAASAQPWRMNVPAAADTLKAGPFEAPAFGATREHQQRAQRMAEAARRMDAAGRRLQLLWSDVLREAASRFMTQLATMPPSSASLGGVRQLYDRWIDCAEQAYAHTAHGEAFCQAQAEFTNASSQWRQEQQAYVERWSTLLDLPTRSEINTLTRRLRAVEAQLRARPRTEPAPVKPTRPATRKTPIRRSKRSKRTKKKS